MKKVTFTCLMLLIISNAFINAVFSQVNGMVTDSSASFLIGNAAGASVISVPPKIDFGLVNLGASNTDHFDHWGNIVLGPDGKYYFAISNHMDQCYLVSYDPNTKSHAILLDSKDILTMPEMKWHGRPDINPNTGNMYLIGFAEGEIVRYNIFTKESENKGFPTPGTGYEEHTWDWERNRLYGLSMEGGVLVYDTQNDLVIHSGMATDSATQSELTWFNRSRLLDRETGILYGSDGYGYIVYYNPVSNSFHKTDIQLQSFLRAWSNERDLSGNFWIFDKVGNVYTFHPDSGTLTMKGMNFGDGCYVAALEMDPEKKYLYYSFVRDAEDVPVVRYNIQNNNKEVIVFLEDYYTNNYSYAPFMIYGCALNEYGSNLFVVSTSYMCDEPAMFDIYIPDVSIGIEEFAIRNNNMDGTYNGFYIDNIYPNPVHGNTSIAIQVILPGEIQMAVYDIQGRRVRDIGSWFFSEGEHAIIWNTQSDNKQVVPPGMYYIRVRSNQGVQTSKIIVLGQ